MGGGLRPGGREDLGSVRIPEVLVPRGQASSHRTVSLSPQNPAFGLYGRFSISVTTPPFISVTILLPSLGRLSLFL